MENIINYYYGITIIKITKHEYYYLIQTEEDTYIFNEIINTEELKQNIEYLNNTNVLYHLLMLTKDKEPFIEYENKTYGLFKVRENKTYNIFSFSNLITNGKSNWGNIWAERIDYYLEQIKEIVEEEEIKYAMDYYISLAEIAITYYNNLQEIYNNNNLTYTLSHHIISSPLDPYTYFNPSNMCIDINIRDIAEYIKYSFFEDILTNKEILNIIDNINLNETIANYLLVRLIYPSYIFKIYDKYIEIKELDDKFYIYMKKSKEYEKLLSAIYNKLKIKYSIKSYIYFFKSQY